MIPQEVLQDWVNKKKCIKHRINLNKKRLKKYAKQEKHFEMRLREITKYEKENI
jgi:hypothetical protein